jgi:hypothetical protein
MGKAFYKGGFEPKMTKKEASLILSLRYLFAFCAHGSQRKKMGY